MIFWALDHPLVCAAAITACGYAIAAAVLWPWRGGSR